MLRTTRKFASATCKKAAASLVARPKKLSTAAAPSSYRAGSLLGYGGACAGSGASSLPSRRGRNFTTAAAAISAARASGARYGSNGNAGSGEGSSSSSWKLAAAAALGAGTTVSCLATQDRTRRTTRCESEAGEAPSRTSAATLIEEEKKEDGKREKESGGHEEEGEGEGEGESRMLASSVSHEFHMSHSRHGGGALVPAAAGGSGFGDPRRSVGADFDDSDDDKNSSALFEVAGDKEAADVSTDIIADHDDDRDDDSLSANVASASSHEEAQAASQNFKVLAAMESKDELQKVQLAKLLSELHKLATESEEQTLPTAAQADDDAIFELRRRLTQDESYGDGEDDEELEELEEGYMRFCHVSDLDSAKAADYIEALRNGDKFERKSLFQLLGASKRLFRREKTLVDLRGRQNVTVVGDLHGSIQCLKDVLDLIEDDLESGASVVFNGDFVDRGDNSLEVVLTLLLLKLSRPNQVFLCRGNHEDSFLSAVYGFEDEVRAKYPDEGKAGGTTGQENKKGDDFDALWRTLSKVFSSMPVCFRTDTAVIMHGGLPHEDFDLSELEAVTVPQRCRVQSTLEPDTEIDRLLQGVLWSDPNPDVEGFIENEGRGAGQVFGPSAAKSFLDRHGLKYVVRSHEVMEQGYDVMDCGNGKSVMTVFSTAAYPNGEGFNKGAVLRLKDDGTATPVQFSRTNQLPNGHLTQKALNSVVEMIAANRPALAEVFESLQDRTDDSEHVTREEWAEVMAGALGLPDLDWMALQPSLAPVTKTISSSSSAAATKSDAVNSNKLQDTGLINWRRFLDLHCVSLGSEEREDEDGDMEKLYANHAMLLTVFKFLDTDGNGSVDPQEFEDGVALLNSRLPEHRRLNDPGKLFKALDLDGNGEIELDEFSEVFKVI